MRDSNSLREQIKANAVGNNRPAQSGASEGSSDEEKSEDGTRNKKSRRGARATGMKGH